jgi:hypothetical protein
VEPGLLAASALLLTLTRRSAWKVDSAIFALTEFSEVQMQQSA